MKKFIHGISLERNDIDMAGRLDLKHITQTTLGMDVFERQGINSAQNLCLLVDL